jgi:hypothetical protein
MYAVFHQTTAASTNVKRSYVYEEVEKLVYGKPTFEYNYELTGRARQIVGVNNFPKDLEYADVLSSWVMCFSLMEGSSVTGDAVETSVSDIVKYLVRGNFVVQPYVMTEAGKPDMDKARKLLAYFWVDSIIRQMTSNGEPRLVGTFDNIMRTNNYLKDDTYARIFSQTTKILGYVYDGFLDAFKQVQSLLESDNLYLGDLSVSYQRILLQATSLFTDRYKEFTCDSTSPRYLMQNALLVNHNLDGTLNPGVSFPDFQVIYPDVVYNKRGDHMTIVMGDEIFQVLKTRIHKGTYVETNRPVPMEFVAQAPTWKPWYMTKVPVSGHLADVPLFASYTRFHTLENVVKTGFYDFFMKNSSLQLITSVRELSQMAGLPEMIIMDILGVDNPITPFAGDTQSLILDFGTAAATCFVYWSSELLPIYSYREVEEGDRANAKLWLADYPYVSTSRTPFLFAFDGKAADLTNPIDPDRKEGGSTPSGDSGEDGDDKQSRQPSKGSPAGKKSSGGAKKKEVKTPVKEKKEEEKDSKEEDEKPEADSKDLAQGKPVDDELLDDKDQKPEEDEDTETEKDDEKDVKKKPAAKPTRRKRNTGKA